MRILLIIALLLTGCSSGEYGTTKDGGSTYGTFEKCEYKEHTYIIYREGFGEARIGGMEHDPDCPKCK